MAGLIYKEWILNRKTILILSATIVFMSFVFVFMPMTDDSVVSSDDMSFSMILILLYLIIFFFVGMFQPNIFAVDETKKWACFVTSTPEMSEGQIGAKYIFGMIMSFGAVLWCNILNNIVALIYGSNTITIVLQLPVIMLFVQFFLRSFEYPFMVRFGSKFGAVYKSGVFFLFIFILLVYFLFGDLSLFDSADAFYEKMLNILSGKGLSDNMLLLLCCMPLLSMILYYLSYRISCRMYLKGAENFDR